MAIIKYNNMDKEQHLEVFNYKYNAWLPCDIIAKLDNSIVKIRCYVYKDSRGNVISKVKKDDNSEGMVLSETFETCGFWDSIRTL